jgi:glutaredoxin
MLKYYLSILVVIFLLRGITFADYYEWTDEQGNVQITDYPPPTKSLKNTKVHKSESESESNNNAASANRNELKASGPVSSANAGRSTGGIILCTDNTCYACKHARDYFTSRGIPFTDYNTDNDSEAYEKCREFQQATGKPRSQWSMPLAIIKGETISGYDQYEYNRAMRRAD